MSDFEEIDDLVNQSASWAKRRQPFTTAKNIFPAKKQSFTQGTNVSFNRKHPAFKKIVPLCREGKITEAMNEAQNDFQRAVVRHLEKFDVNDDDNAFIRQIESGKRGANSPVEVILGYDAAGNSITETVGKDEIYAIDGRKYRGRLEGLLPSASAPMEVVQEQPASQGVGEERDWEEIFKNWTPYVRDSAVNFKDSCKHEGFEIEWDEGDSVMIMCPSCGGGVQYAKDPLGEVADYNLAPEDEENMETSTPDGPVDELIASGGKNESSEPVHVPSDGGEPEGGGEVASPPSSDLLRRLLGNQLVSDLEKLGLREKITIERDVGVDGISIYNGRSGGPIRADLVSGDNVVRSVKFKGLITDSAFAGTDAPEDAKPFRADDMGKALRRIFQPKLLYAKQRGGRQNALGSLRIVRKHMASLSTVFGFDDPAQLEAFFAAWLMKDSTCRLTGIPGTGKTTVINSAATLMCNSYGYNLQTRYLARDKVEAGVPHQPLIFPNGQTYNVNYGSKEYEEIRREWESWRFNEWDEGSHKSGAYLYDFRFLQKGENKLSMTPEAFHRMLLSSDITEVLSTEEQLLKETVVVSHPIKKSQIMKAFGGRMPASVTDNGGSLSWDGHTLYNDSGANEGYWLREFLLEHFYDARLDDGERGLDLIANEMLMETGIAKVDYDKRAEEILYGIEIRQVTTTDRISGNTVASYEFEPTPRPIVTQPIKFFNEANRSGSGVEDAILGLIAEKTVEYRGRTFTSPSFVSWMDTNPHQKGNDLAFVDRIDMELYLGSLSLGSRFATLSERYGNNANGTAPQLQLIGRMLMSSDASDYLSPMRFKDLTSLWKTVNGVPFNPQGVSDETGGALLDISLLSVLFTQRFMVKERTDNIYGQEHTYSYDDNVYASPLVDISTTTNLQYESQHKEELEKFGTGEDGTKSQAPVLIKRMLGFRFTNSLIKMTRALSFLRGKEFVTRQEVVDSLPYCVGHRLGPAREGEDPKGRDIGIVRDGMRMTNEQEFIRQLIVHGYLLRDTNSLLGAVTSDTPSMFDIWDSFLNTCIEQINSGESYWKYEDLMLLPLKARVRQGGDITPVHWHIGTMVVENIRRSKSSQRDGMNYKQRYNRYLEALSSPKLLSAKSRFSTKQQVEDMVSDHAASEYYRMRGMIASDDLLFSDDRENLLKLCESKINAITGKEMLISQDAIPSSSVAVAQSFSSEPRSGPNPLQFKWRTYGDSLGVWGRLISNGGNANIGIADLGGGDLLDVAGVGLESNQNFAIKGTFEVGVGQQHDSPFFIGMESVVRFLAPYVLGNGSVLGTLQTPAPKGSMFGPLSSITLQEYALQAKDLMFRWLNKEAGLPLDDGFMACFKLKHAFDGAINGFEGINGDDDLRLWLRLRVIRGRQSDKFATFALFAGITSATMKPIRQDADGNNVEWDILDFNDAETYNPERYYNPATWSQEKYEDAGNLTKDDIRFFSENIYNAVRTSQ